MKNIFILILILSICSIDMHAQTLTQKLIGHWQFKEVLDASRNRLEGTVNPIKLDLRKDGTYSMLTKSKKQTGLWKETDSTLYLQSMSKHDSTNHTQVMRILKIDSDLLEIYAGAEKGNEIRFIYTRPKKIRAQ